MKKKPKKLHKQKGKSTINQSFNQLIKIICFIATKNFIKIYQNINQCTIMVTII